MRPLSTSVQTLPNGYPAGVGGGYSLYTGGAHRMGYLFQAGGILRRGRDFTSLEKTVGKTDISVLAGV